MREKMGKFPYAIVYRALYTILLAGIVLCGAGEYLGVVQPGYIHWFMVAIAVLLLVGMNYGELNIKIFSTGILFLCVLLIIPLIGADSLTGFHQSYVQWLFRREGYDPEWLQGYELMQTVWVVAVCYIFQILTEKKRILRELAAVLLLVCLIVCLVWGIDIAHAGVVLTITYAALCFIERTRMGWKKKKEGDYREYTLWMMPFVLAYMIFMLLIPVQEEPYDWEWASAIYVNVSEKVTVLVNDIFRRDTEDFGVAMAGFSENAGLRSGVKRSDKELLTLTGGRGWPVNIYLIGKTYNTFDGRQWEHTVEDTLQEFPLDMLETEYAVRRYDEPGLDNYIYDAKLDIRYERFYTGYLFAPMKVKKLNTEPYHPEGRDLVWEEKCGYGTEYGVFYWQMNLTNPKFYEMLEADLPEDEEMWEKVVKIHYRGNDDLYQMDQLKEYRRAIQRNYYEEVTLSEEVRQYVDEITKDCETDLQRLRAIEKALSGYTYTTMPGELPEGIESQEDFLDYFLLESKKGYCSYFASAFVLLARAEGFPARYVEGFCIPTTKDMVATATADRVHAWPEVYIEGVGWIPFEPTPGYGEIRQEGWKVKEETEINEPLEEKPTVSNKWEQWRTEGEEGIPGETVTETPDGELQEKGTHLKILLIATAVVCLTCIVIVWVESLVLEYRYRRMNTEGKFLTEIKRILGIWARLGYRRAENETLSELQKRLQEAFAESDGDEVHSSSLQYYQEYLYRGNAVSEEILKETITERKELLQRIKQERKWYYYVLCIRLKTGFL